MTVATHRIVGCAILKILKDYYVAAKNRKQGIKYILLKNYGYWEQ